MCCYSFVDFIVCKRGLTSHTYWNFKAKLLNIYGKVAKFVHFCAFCLHFYPFLPTRVQNIEFFSTFVNDMSTLRCYIITDDAAASQLMKQYIDRTPMLECAGVFTSAREAFPGIAASEADVVIAGAEMPQLGGLELSRLLPAGCRLVLLSSSPGNAAEVYDAGVADYLLMPVSYERFATCARRLLSAVGSATNAAERSMRSIFVKSDYKVIQVPVDEILFVEGLKDYVKFYLGHDQRSVMSLMSMKTLEAHLPPDMFMRVHRSYIVNLHHIRTIDRGRIVFGPHHIPVGETYRPNLQQYIASRSVAERTTTDK